MKKRTALTTVTAVAVLGAATYGVAYPNLPYGVQHPFSETAQAADGTTIHPREGKVAASEDGRKYAPDPAASYRHATCDLSPKSEAQPDASSWQIPSRDLTAPLEPTSATDPAISLPDAPAGISYTPGAGLTDETGVVLDAGHVDYPAGAKSSGGGELSAFGYLHEIPACTHIYQTDADGQTREFVTTDLYTVKQSDLPSEDIWRKDGSKSLVMITCSGKSVEDVGNSLGFDYSHNLVLNAVPVQ
ncbi:class F sortase [uncultured Corynebacterium sp.]|uniref:class F sortase n=1 Tax=uncultured Corynebacterium sp. TaxID=159447 RepID=UPI0025FDEC2C|nr:class F sortase [uncultured Corynebacterium sp.]